MSRVAFFHYHLRPGGYERLLVNLLNEIELSGNRPILILLRREGAFLDRLRADVEIIELGTQRLRRSIPRLVRVVKQEHIDVLCTGHTQINLLALAAARLCRGLEVVIGEHTPLSLAVAEMARPRMTLALMRWLYPQAFALAVPVPELGAEIAQMLDRPELRVRLLHNPVLGPSSAAERDEEPPIPWPDSPVVVAAGRLIRAKGFDVLIRAIDRLMGAHLLLLGDGPERPALSRLAEQLGVSERVTFCGEVANPLAFFRRADVVASASRRESFGNVLIEAMFCGTPVVATDCWAGSGFAVRDGAAGQLVPPDDVESLAEALGRVLGDSVVADRLISGGLDWSQQFTIAGTVPEYAKLLEGTVS